MELQQSVAVLGLLCCDSPLPAFGVARLPTTYDIESETYVFRQSRVHFFRSATELDGANELEFK